MPNWAEGNICAQFPEDQYSCEDVMTKAGILKSELPKEAHQ